MAKILTLIFILFLSFESYTQDNMVIHSTGNFNVHSNAQVHLFGNFRNQSGNDSFKLINSQSTFVFYGDSFQQLANNRVFGNGSLVFLQPRPAPYFSNSIQYIDNANSSSSLPNFLINNSNNVQLLSDVKVRDTTTFSNGHFLLSNNNYYVGNGWQGFIRGYSENRYFVTNSSLTDTRGFLIRENTGTNTVDFPVGISTGDYTPARLTNTGSTDTFKVKVFQNVYENGNSGPTTETNNLSVQRTWIVQEGVNGGSDVDLTLQHNSPTEGSLYSASANYISRYWGSQNNTAYLDNSQFSYWDYAAPGNDYGNSAGTITTGSNYGLMSNRAGITSDFSGNTQFFTKASSLRPLPLVEIILNAKWTDIYSKKSFLNFNINNANLLQKIEIYRSVDGKDFQLISSINDVITETIANFTFIDETLNKELLQNNVIYKIVGISKNEELNYSNLSELYLPKIGNNFMVYPVPTKDFIYISSTNQISNVNEKYTIMIYDYVGKLIYQNQVSAFELNNSFALDLSLIAKGKYFVEILNFKNEKDVFQILNLGE